EEAAENAILCVSGLDNDVAVLEPKLLDTVRLSGCGMVDIHGQEARSLDSSIRRSLLNQHRDERTPMLKPETCDILHPNGAKVIAVYTDLWSIRTVAQRYIFPSTPCGHTPTRSKRRQWPMRRRFDDAAPKTVVAHSCHQMRTMDLN